MAPFGGREAAAISHFGEIVSLPPGEAKEGRNLVGYHPPTCRAAKATEGPSRETGNDILEATPRRGAGLEHLA